MERFYLASDHRGLALKDQLKTWLTEIGYEVLDVTPPLDPQGMIDFPLAGKAVALPVAEEKGLGILVCGSGIGVAIEANRFKGVRAAEVHTPQEIATAKEHDHINVLCLGADTLTFSRAQAIVEAWLSAEEDSSPRRLRRLAQLDEYGS